MNRSVGVGIAVVAAWITASVAGYAGPAPDANPAAGLTASDKGFLSYAAEDNQAEIQLCLLAEKRAAAPAVKAFARLMVDDHVEIESRLAAVANGLNVDLPDGVGQEGQKTMAKLGPLKGANFDSEFMQAQIKDHSDDLKKFAATQSSTTNDHVRQFISQTIPLLQQHLELAQSVVTSVGGRSRTTGSGSR
jgi:putative membrane protein